MVFYVQSIYYRQDSYKLTDVQTLPKIPQLCVDMSGPYIIIQIIAAYPYYYLLEMTIFQYFRRQSVLLIFQKCRLHNIRITNKAIYSR